MLNKNFLQVGSITAQKLSETSDSEMGWKEGVTKKVKEQYEGAESRDFWEGFGGSAAKNRHFSLLDDEHSYDWTMRMWHLEAKHDSFQANEVTCTYRATAVPNPLPVLQLDLYSAQQPGYLFPFHCYPLCIASPINFCLHQRCDIMLCSAGANNYTQDTC